MTCMCDIQTCVSILLDRMEARAQHGFKCRLGRENNVLFFPRLSAMTLDAIERVKYFGLRSVRTCGICRLRRGRSATRMATRHQSHELNNNLTLANAPAHTREAKSSRKRVRDQLKRHGWNFKKRCRLDDHAKKIIVPSDVFAPALPYGGLIRCDVMHVYFINYCTYVLTLLAKLVPQGKYSQINDSVKACHQFRSVRSYFAKIHCSHIIHVIFLCTR